MTPATHPQPHTTPRPWYLLGLSLCLLFWLAGCPTTPPSEGGAPDSGTPDSAVADSTKADTTPTEPVAKSGTFTAMSYNVHGLPKGITKDDTNARLEAIGPLLKPYTILGLQEVFVDDGYELMKAPLKFVTHTRYAEKKENRFYGSGLLVLAQFPLVEEKTLLYKDCFGTVDNASDCLASKGLQMVRIKLADGVELDVYNSHFEAGNGDEDKAARASNVKEVTDAIAKWSPDRAILFLGDTNLKEERSGDKETLANWIKAAGLTDSCEAVNCTDKGRIDRVFFRNSKTLILTAKSWSIPEGFKDKTGTPLSDHDPILVEFGWETKP